MMSEIVAYLSDTDVRGLAIVAGVLTLLIKQWRNDKTTKTAADAAQEAAAQLKNNGGNSFLDKAEQRHAELVDRLDRGGDRFAAIEARLDAMGEHDKEAAETFGHAVNEYLRTNTPPG